MTEEPPIQKIESPTEMRLEWDNRRARHDNFLFWFFVLFWIIWAPVTVFASIMIFRSDSPVFFSIWCIFGWAGTLGIPYSILPRSWSEWICISPDLLICGQRGLLAPKPKQISIKAVYEIGIGHYDPDDRESFVTLNINYFTPKMRKVRHMIGFWLHPTLKEKVFCEMKEFAEKHHLSMVFQRY